MPRGTLKERPGDHHADIAAHDTYLDGFPHDTFERLRREEPVVWGASLAELEVRVFFEEFLDRVTDFEVAEPDRLRSNFIRGIKHLPVRLS